MTEPPSAPNEARGNTIVGAVLILGAVTVGASLDLWLPLIAGSYVLALAVNACLLVRTGLRARMPSRIPLALAGAPVVAVWDFAKVVPIALLAHAVRSLI